MTMSMLLMLMSDIHFDIRIKVDLRFDCNKKLTLTSILTSSLNFKPTARAKILGMLPLSSL